jgi:hypothetical protein
MRYRVARLPGAPASARLLLAYRGEVARTPGPEPVSGCFSTSQSGTPVQIAKNAAASGMFNQNQCISLLLQAGLHTESVSGALRACERWLASRSKEPPVVTGEALTTPASSGPRCCRVRGMPSHTRCLHQGPPIAPLGADTFINASNPALRVPESEGLQPRPGDSESTSIHMARPGPANLARTISGRRFSAPVTVTDIVLLCGLPIPDSRHIVRAAGNCTEGPAARRFQFSLAGSGQAPGRSASTPLARTR